ncbi:glucokinase [Lutimaribacter sp. EGI FJ00015]|uniref:Glucokinase n=1 Tax=Lutimaribacter degradans TaxID=2945989 RepID=A0ACC5ZV87_9RHOB|nr:glucokinase [Lutimaribacter sp. EGI FJ00013]MCM2562268.1 glucokinase [Lutimaribacter sp. EGI FJ00013]MCO0613423.1 glucokinase [Lutimaribacter sp. EGI FJ00015]MCO0636397.1 glucokinase [Lutimaribacter sp. EGI FJ00014]
MDLIGDIGGTSARFALAEIGRVLTGTVWSAPDALGDDLAAMIHAYLAGPGAGARPRGVALAGAGVLRGQRLTLSNRDMTLTPETIRAALGDAALPVRLFNDMVAQGHGLAHLPDGGVRRLAGPGPGKGPALVVNIGTGLNACVVHDMGGTRFVPPAEAGNVTLPQVSPGLRALALARGGEVVAEDVISGRGLPWLADAMCGARATGAAALALAPVCATLAEALAAYLRDMALVHIARGGVYLTGGVAAALADSLDWAALHRAMVGQGAHADLLGQVGLLHVTDPWVTLRGAAALSARP